MATIVVVEDERDLNNLVRRHLEDEGHRVVQVFDGPSALPAVQQEPPDLVILDWMPPALDAGPLRVDLGERTVAVAGRPVELTPKEFDLLALLVRNPGRAFGRE